MLQHERLALLRDFLEQANKLKSFAETVFGEAEAADLNLGQGTEYASSQIKLLLKELRAIEES